MTLSEVLTQYPGIKKVKRGDGLTLLIDKNDYFYPYSGGPNHRFAAEELTRTDWEPVIDHEKCPFCGGSDAYDMRVRTDESIAIHCGTCHAEGPVKPTESEAWAAWDRRVK